MSAKPRGKYGIDAPAIPWVWVGTALAAGVIAALLAGWRAAWWSDALAALFVAGAVVCLIGAALYWHASLRGKFIVWDRLLREVSPAGHPRVLDLGCGRGMVAVMVATRWAGAAVTGIDLWRSVDQSGNTPEAAAQNAALNGVDTRVRYDTGDLTRLPYPDRQFTLVTASLSIHNLPTEDGRRAAVREAARVLAPGGTLIIVDIQRTGECADELRRGGLAVVGPSPLGWRTWWTGPWIATSVLTATR